MRNLRLLSAVRASGSWLLAPGSWLLAGFCLLSLWSCARQPELPVYGSVPEFVLTAQTGQEFRSSDALKGKVWVADFIFTSCMGPCPRMTQQMRWVQKQTQDLPDVRMVSVTVDPETDEPQVLADFAKQFHADTSRWFFLTGPVQTLNHLGYDVMKLNAVDGQNFDHSTRFVLVDQRANIRGYYDTSEQEALKKLVGDIRRLAGHSS